MIVIEFLFLQGEIIIIPMRKSVFLRSNCILWHIIIMEIAKGIKIVQNKIFRVPWNNSGFSFNTCQFLLISQLTSSVPWFKICLLGLSSCQGNSCRNPVNFQMENLLYHFSSTFDVCWWCWNFHKSHFMDYDAQTTYIYVGYKQYKNEMKNLVYILRMLGDKVEEN